ncbi:MAG TPA: glycosyltransferase [Cytophagaceae bacterium]|jgi:1,2-diacylglycerol 3-beta-glucosyltransferase|nr:glycosyltransferase [Cytophagaceae bacterium]
MIFLHYFLAGYFLLLFGYFGAIIFLFLRLKKDEPSNNVKEQPFISILVAARNEEKNILSCLQAIEALSWPIGKLEVLIGNDQSTDETENIIRNFIKDKNHFKLFQIQHPLGLARAKANVLGQLAKNAKGDFFFITDADVRVPQKWIQGLLSNYNENTGIVSGVTYTRGNNLFHYCQNIDWIYAFGMIKTVSDHSIPVTAVGNNMMISRSAYESTGGYENISFSVTEDLQLFLETLKCGWIYKNLMSADCLAETNPIDSLSKLFSQRKRWMQGAVRLPKILLLFLLLQAIFIPMIAITISLSPFWGIVLWVIKIGMQQCFIVFSFKKIGKKYDFIKGFIPFEIYSGLLSIIVLILYFIPTRVHWKGRKY